jgi:hypothetical protein
VTIDRSHAPDSLGAWLREHALQLLAVAFSTLAAACYFVGRSALLGWYQAAGVSHLTFAWPAQDVIIRGVLQLWTWLYAFLITFLTAVTLALVDWLSSAYNGFLMRGC